MVNVYNHKQEIHLKYLQPQLQRGNFYCSAKVHHDTAILMEQLFNFSQQAIYSESKN